jgi:hypothetical protein
VAASSSAGARHRRSLPAKPHAYPTATPTEIASTALSARERGVEVGITARTSVSLGGRIVLVVWGAGHLTHCPASGRATQVLRTYDVSSRVTSRRRQTDFAFEELWSWAEAAFDNALVARLAEWSESEIRDISWEHRTKRHPDGGDRCKVLQSRAAFSFFPLQCIHLSCGRCSLSSPVRPVEVEMEVEVDHYCRGVLQSTGTDCGHTSPVEQAVGGLCASGPAEDYGRCRRRCNEAGMPPSWLAMAVPPAVLDGEYERCSSLARVERTCTCGGMPEDLAIGARTRRGL